MSSYNNVTKIKYSGDESALVNLLEYIVFADDKAKEKYLVFRFRNNVTQQLLAMQFEVCQYDIEGNMVEKSVVIYNKQLAGPEEEFVPKAKLRVSYQCATISINLVNAAFDRFKWHDGEFEDNTYKFDYFFSDEMRQPPVQQDDKGKKGKKKQKTKQKETKKVKKDRNVAALILGLLGAIAAFVGGGLSLFAILPYSSLGGKYLYYTIGFAVCGLGGGLLAFIGSIVACLKKKGGGAVILVGMLLQAGMVVMIGLLYKFNILLTPITGGAFLLLLIATIVACVKRDGTGSSKRRFAIKDTTRKNVAKFPIVFNVLIFLVVIAYVLTTVLLYKRDTNKFTIDDYYVQYTGSRNDKNISIYGYGGSEEHLVIPGQLGEYRVLKIEEGAFKNSNLISVTFNSSVTVASNAFKNSTKLQSVKGNDSITVNAYAFDGCTALNYLDLAAGSNLRPGSLYGCKTSINIMGIEVPPEQRNLLFIAPSGN